MNPWHAAVDSEAFRWVTKRGPTRVFFRSEAFRRADIARRRMRATRALRRESPFSEVATFCIFVGHNKSGTSLLGGLLDAHCRIALADEIDVLQYVDAGLRRDEIFHVLLRGSHTEARKGRITARRLEPYSFHVPDQWQGRTQVPLVVGDSTSGSSTRRLGQDPGLLDRTRRVANGADVKLIQVIRNPFDPISVMMVRGKRSFDNAIDHYFRACSTLADLRRRVDPSALLSVYYEAFCADPEGHLAQTCRFLSVEPDAGYLRACGSIIHREPDRSRARVNWTPSLIAHVEHRIAEFDFLDGYSYAS
jgi:Sulfotransferase family